MAEAALKGLLSCFAKPMLDNVVYWIELLQGEHISTEGMTREAVLLQAALLDTYNCRSSSYMLWSARNQAEDLHTEIGAIVDDARWLSRYDHPSSTLDYFLKYGHNIWRTPPRWKTAKNMVKIQPRIQQLLGILTPFVSKDEGSAVKKRLQNRHVAALPQAIFKGMEKPLNLLFDYLKTGANQRQVAIVAGKHGAGKTTLVHYVYENLSIKGCFNCHAWVLVDISLQLNDILQVLLIKLYKEANMDTPKGIDSMDADMLGSIIRHFLEKEQRRYVIVLDNISTRAQLKTILDLAIPDENCNNFGRIIVTSSRCQDVAGACNNTQRIEIEQLSTKEVCTLFCSKASLAADVLCELEASDLPQKISDLCDGLPFTIELLGGLLSQCSFSQCSSIIAELQEYDHMEILERSINDLSDMARPNLMKCLMYFSMFPKGHAVTHNTLLRLWIAEGFIHVRGQETHEEIAKEYLNILIQRHIVQVAEQYHYGRPKSYRLNGLMHDKVWKKAEEENFCTTVKSLSDSPEQIRRLSIQVTIRKYPKTVRLRKLISLFISRNTSHVPKLLSSTRSLKILNLTDELIEVFPKEIAKLTHLRYLNLGNSKIRKLPSSIGNLRNLQTLILKGTLVSELPKAILQAKQLQHLLAYRYDIEKKPDRQPDIINGVRVPKGIGCLEELKTFSVIDTNEESSTVKELHKLTKLRRLGIVNLKENDGPELCKALAEMGELSSISLTSANNEHINLQNLVTMQPNLERLYLRGMLSLNENFFLSLQALVRLRLVRSSLAAKFFNELQQLPNLVELALIQAFNDDNLNCIEDGFPELKILDLDQLDSLVVMNVHGSLRKLHKLIIRNCSKLRSVPLGIEQLKELKELHLFDMPEPFLEKIQKGNVNYRMVQNIELICYYKDGFPQGQTET
ncbi:hypothetical protein BS78_07G138100 [Paspalum vaginatum]|nr:hypothetical protein BS78_07G138100 [Paspalum vaginatum]